VTTVTAPPTTGQPATAGEPPGESADLADAPANLAGAPAAQPTDRDVPGATVWLTGLPSAGKTTVARAVADELTRLGRRVEVLDGDVVRETLCADLGFSRADRDTNVARIGFVAALLAKHGVIALAPVISPYAAARDAVRSRHEAAGAAFLEVHVATPVEDCAARDVKGLYARQRAGEISGLTGVDDPYEPPVAPELRVQTSGTVDETAAAVLAALTERGLLP
jgi:adenylylsulfate kinase